MLNPCIIFHLPSTVPVLLPPTANDTLPPSHICPFALMFARRGAFPALQSFRTISAMRQVPWNYTVLNHRLQIKASCHDTWSDECSPLVLDTAMAPESPGFTGCFPFGVLMVDTTAFGQCFHPLYSFACKHPTRNLHSFPTFRVVSFSSSWLIYTWLIISLIEIQKLNRVMAAWVARSYS
jgi:hypothetical protein